MDFVCRGYCVELGNIRTFIGISHIPYTPQDNEETTLVLIALIQVNKKGLAQGAKNPMRHPSSIRSALTQA